MDPLGPLGRLVTVLIITFPVFDGMVLAVGVVIGGVGVGLALELYPVSGPGGTGFGEGSILIGAGGTVGTDTGAGL